MKRKTAFTGPGFRIALITLALVVVGFTQFLWYSRAAAAELEDAHHSLAGTVAQTFAREYQRYVPLVESMRVLAESARETPGETRKALERILGLYGPEGTVSGLVSSVGLAAWADPSVTGILVTGGAWEPGPSAFPVPVPDSARNELAAGRIVFVYGTESDSDLFLLARAGSELIAVAEIDTGAFLAAYIMPAVEAALPGAKIEWEKTGTPFLPGRKDGAVNPLGILLGVNSERMRTFRIGLPGPADFNKMHRTGPFEGDSRRGPGNPNYRPLNGDDSHDGAKAPGTITVVMPENSTVGAMERRLSLNWLMSVLFLAGIGLAFAQTIVQKDKLREVGEREREFVASVTHELRTPVTAIQTAAYNMSNGFVGPERMGAYGEMICSQSARLASMIEEILLFAQVEGRAAQPPVRSEIRPAELLDALRQPLDEIASSSGIAVHWNFGALPGRFFGDGGALHIILGNLVSNALFHAYPGDGKGEVRVVGRISMPDTLQFIVEDDGRGIAKAEARRVFEPFYRDGESGSRHEKGSGLGLFIAARKAEMLGGKLTLESPYRRIDGSRKPGCRFMLELPLKEMPDVQ